MRGRLFAACLGVAAAACFVVAYLNRNADLEGAYLITRKEGGWTAYAPTDDPSELGNSVFNPFDPWDGYLWLGAGIALVLVALATLVLETR